MAGEKLEDAEDADDDGAGARTAGDGAEELCAVQPVVWAGGCFETRGGAHIGAAVGDDAAIAHDDDSAVVGADGVERVDLGDAVGARCLPVCAARQDGAQMRGPSKVPPVIGM